MASLLAHKRRRSLPRKRLIRPARCTSSSRYFLKRAVQLYAGLSITGAVGTVYSVEYVRPVFHWLDGLIHEDGDYLYMVLVYLSLPLIAWILNGGLRRRQARQQHIVTIPVIVIRHTAEPPPLPSPPEISPADRPPSDDGAQSFAA
jgi:hypothetical protein